MYFFHINTYDCIKKPKVKSTLLIDDWFSQIKHSDYSEQILKARDGQLDYNQTKAQVPCVTYNFLFDDYKKDANIKTSSGLIYIDIDNPLFDINTLDLTKVYSYYRSFGGNGYAILTKVSGLTLDNFHCTHSSITDELGITEFIDKQAVKASQFNVLSYDSNIYINKDSYTFSSVTSATPSMVIREEEKAYTTDRGANYKCIRFDNLDEIPITNDYVVNWDGYEYIRCFIPIKKVKVKRNNFLLSYCNNLVYLNPEIHKEKTIEILNKVNHVACEPPVDLQQIHRVVSSIHKYNKAGKLNPIHYWKTRKIVFDKNCKLTRADKMDICHKEIALHKTSQSKQKLYAILESWDFEKHGAISQRKVYNNHPITKKTVEKYWSGFKDYVTILNDEVGKS